MDNFKFDDMYKEVTQEEKVNEIKRQNKVQAHYEQLMKIGSSCLNDPKFKVFRDQYEKFEKEVVDAMIRYTRTQLKGSGSDMNLYGANMLRYVTKLETVKLLISSVEATAKDNRKDG